MERTLALLSLLPGRDMPRLHMRSFGRLEQTLAAMLLYGGLLVVPAAIVMAADAPAKKEVVPHAQDKPPGPPLSPQEALAKMSVPEGFSVELVASEPDLVNPVA